MSAAAVIPIPDQAPALHLVSSADLAALESLAVGDLYRDTRQGPVTTYVQITSLSSRTGVTYRTVAPVPTGRDRTATPSDFIERWTLAAQPRRDGMAMFTNVDRDALPEVGGLYIVRSHPHLVVEVLSVNATRMGVPGWVAWRLLSGDHRRGMVRRREFGGRFLSVEALDLPHMSSKTAE